MPHLPKPKRRTRTPGQKISGHNTRRNRDYRDQFYNTTVWRKLRTIHIQDNPICKWCDEEDRTTPATVVDHIVPIKQGGERTNKDNLQSLCERCHAQKSAWEADRTKRPPG
jgi:5-methylcytosine-specific restriction protein A